MAKPSNELNKLMEWYWRNGFIIKLDFDAARELTDAFIDGIDESERFGQFGTWIMFCNPSQGWVIAIPPTGLGARKSKDKLEQTEYPYEMSFDKGRETLIALGDAMTLARQVYGEAGCVVMSFHPSKSPELLIYPDKLEAKHYEALQ